MPTVSVIIPCYNAEKYLSEAIESVLAQTWNGFETIVVDDGSTDNSAEIVRSFRDSRIRYVYQANKGLSGARNTGIRHTRSKYITFLDADDTYLPDRLLSQVAYLDSHPEVGLVAGGYLRTDEKGNVLYKNRPNPQAVHLKDILKENRFIVTSTLIRRIWVERINGFDETLRGSEEWDFHYRLAAAGCVMHHVSDIVCTYRFTPESLSANIDLQTQSRLKVVEKIFRDETLIPWITETKEKAIGKVYLKGASHAYSLGRSEEGKYYLEQALEHDADLHNHGYQKIALSLSTWLLHIPLYPPSQQLKAICANLPKAIDNTYKFGIKMKFSLKIKKLMHAKSSEDRLMMLRLLVSISINHPISTISFLFQRVLGMGLFCA